MTRRLEDRLMALFMEAELDFDRARLLLDRVIDEVAKGGAPPPPDQPAPP